MPKVVEPQIPNYPPQGIQAQLDLLYLWNPDAANELIKQLEEAIKEVQSNLDYNKLVNKPTLDTTSTNALVAGTEEVAGIVKLHKVSKTGSYEDLNDKPDLDLYATKTELSAGLESKADKTALPQNQTGTAGQVYTKTETGAEWQNASGGSSLPDQTGNAGKFLTTDGTNASWGGGYCAVPKSNTDYTTVVLDAKNYVSNFNNASVVISPTSSDTPQGLSTTIFARMGGVTSVGIGFDAYAGGDDSISVGGLSSANAPDALAIGYSATATAANAIQLGTGVNSASSTFQVFDKQLMDANGHIPAERLASDGTTGQVLSKTDTGMEWKTVSGGGSSADNNGLEGDYCSKYGIVDETASGLPTQGTGNQIIIPAQLVMDVPGVVGLTTNESEITHDLVSTTDCEIFLSEGTVIEATDVFFQTDEPQNGATGFAAWWNGTEWKFKSNDTGNVWRAANAVRIAKCIFTDGTLTRLCFTGCRVLNKQEWLPKNGITTTGTEFSYVIKTKNGDFTCKCDSYFGSYWAWGIGANFLQYGYGSVGTIGGTSARGARLYKTGGVCEFYVGTQWDPLDGLYTKTINGGAADAEITVPTTSGTMVVATPPTAAGLVLVSTETGSEWSDVIGNINTLLDSINGEVA